MMFTLLTWSRTGKVRFAVWSEIEGLDGGQPVRRVPAERMKKRHEHLVPLSSQAVLILRRRKELVKGTPGGFSSRETGPGARCPRKPCSAAAIGWDIGANKRYMVSGRSVWDHFHAEFVSEPAALVQAVGYL